MNVAIIVFPGSNCDRDVAYVTRDLLGWPTRMVWHQERELGDVNLVVLPGGFSYGDYLRCGAIARFSPIMPAIRAHAAAGKWLLGICNGFQILTEVGLLPGALVRNRDLHFICNQAPLLVENTDLGWTNQYSPGQVIQLPIAHGEGAYYAPPEVIARLESQQQVVFRYGNLNGTWGSGDNPNGSLNNIAGICNATGNVLGMMPHPERAADILLGGLDGMTLFKSLDRAPSITAVAV